MLCFNMLKNCKPKCNNIQFKDILDILNFERNKEETLLVLMVRLQIISFLGQLNQSSTFVCWEKLNYKKFNSNCF